LTISMQHPATGHDGAKSAVTFREMRNCPMCDKLKVEIDSFQAQAYKAGYEYVAWVVTKGPNCELVTFASTPTEQELRDRFGNDLISIVPL
jgi:hypothetical protein